jgi:capsular exopolysaccharide synthesis family protein
VGILSQEQVAPLADYTTNSKYSQAYQTLYANIRLSWDSQPVKQQTILLATPTAYSGQAAVAASIATAAAQSGTPAVLVDADLHTPSLHQRFAVSNDAGLSDLLAMTSITSQAVVSRLQPTCVPGLRLLCAGSTPPSSTHLLLSSRLQDVVTYMCQIVAEIEGRSGIIIFHSAPVLDAIDAVVIATLVAQTFLTIVSGRTTRSQAKQAQEQLQRVHAHLAGAILLDV